MARRPFCSEAARDAGEPLTATASRIDRWLLVEYRGRWDRDALGGSLLSEPLKAHLRGQVALLGRARLLFVKRPEPRPQRLTLFLGVSLPGAERLHALEFDRHDDLLDLDLVEALGGGRTPGAPVEHPLFVACTHGRRDRCCARYGQPLYRALRSEVDPARAWQSTHVGGDRFAGNLVVLPEGIYYGRVGADDVGPIVREHGRGRIRLSHYRGRSIHPFPVQAAERAVRARARLRGLADLSLVAAGHVGAGWRVRFRDERRGDLHVVDVAARRDRAARYLTCEAAEPRRPLRYRVVAHRVAAGE